MGKALKLVNKLKRRQKHLKNQGAGFDRKDKMDQGEERMARSQKAYGAMLRPQRRLDRNLGQDMVGHEPKISKKNKISTVERYDFGGSDYGIRLTMAAGLIADMKLALGDVVRFLNGNLKGQYLKVEAIPDSTHLRLEDNTDFVVPPAAETSEIETAGLSGVALDGKYFTIHSANDATAYYVWFDMDGNFFDPMVPAHTGIVVSYLSSHTDAQIAGILASVLEGHADFTASANGTLVTVSNVATGPATNTADGSGPGATLYSFSTTVQGTAGSQVWSESDKVARFQPSDVKGSYR